MPRKAASKKRARKSVLQVDLAKIRTMLQVKCKVEDLPIIPPAGTYAIQELSPAEVSSRINATFQVVYQQMQGGTWPSIEVPLRRRENIVHDNRGNYFFGNIMQELKYDGEYPDFLQTLRVAQVVNELVTHKVHATKREVFYCDVGLFEDQRSSDRAIENVATLIGTRRNCLNVVASAKGVCIGRLRLRDKTDIIDCESLGCGGWGISPLLDNIEILESDAEFILVVEKDAAVIHLTESRFWKDVPCIIITGKGQPDMSTQEFIRRLVAALHLPVLGLCDSDPYGLDILLHYAHGSVQAAHETPWTAINDFWWLGVRPGDLNTYHIPESCLLTINRGDKQRAEYMLKEPGVLGNPAIKQELELMLQTKNKAEIQALSSRGLTFLVDYIIQKLETGDLVHL